MIPEMARLPVSPAAGANKMDFLRFANWGALNDRGYPIRAAVAPSQPDYEDLSTVLQDPHLRRDIARRPDLVRFVRDDAA